MLVLLFAPAAPAGAQTCTVPGSHSTIQAAIDDPACATIDLSAQTYAESIILYRSLTLAGPAGGAAVVQGLVRATGPATQVALEELRVENGCAPSALESVGGAELTGVSLEVEGTAGLPCPPAVFVFADGFETGDTSAWSTTVP